MKSCHIRLILDIRTSHTSQIGDLAQSIFLSKNDNTIDLDYPCALQNTLVFGLQTYVRESQSHFSDLDPFLGKYQVTITSLCSVAEISLLSILSGTCGHHIPGGHFCPTHRSSQKLAIFPKITSEGQNVLFLSSGITENQSQCPI